jgi:hypothetical protein
MQELGRAGWTRRVELATKRTLTIETGDHSCVCVERFCFSVNSDRDTVKRCGMCGAEYPRTAL